MIIDIHTHITPDGFAKYIRRLGRQPFSAATLVRRMDMEGIDRSVVLPLANPENDDLFGVVNNRECLTACRKHPDRLIPFCNIDPRAMLNTPEADLSQIMRIYKELGCAGIGEICANIPITDPRYQNLVAHAGAQGLPLIFHFAGREGGLYGVIDAPGLPGLAKSLAAFPKAIMFGHSPAFWNEIDGHLDPAERDGYPKGKIEKPGALWQLFEKYPNLYGDLSAGSAHNAISRDPEVGYKFLRRFYQQLCFATDRFSALNEPVPPILTLMKEVLAQKELTRAQYDDIMYRNAQRVIPGIS